MTKKKYKVYIQYTMTGHIIVEADNKEEAYNIANNENNDYALSDVINPDYVSGSWSAFNNDEDDITEVN